MTTATPEKATVTVKEPDKKLPGHLLREAQRIGAASMTQEDVNKQFASLMTQLINGVRGDEHPRLLASRTRTPQMTQAALDSVEVKAKTFVEEWGGETIKLKLAEKQASGLVVVGETLFERKYDRNERQLTHAGLITRLTAPIIAHAHLLEDQPMRVALSVGQPQENRRTPNGMTVELKPKGDGVLVKEWVIENWNKVPVKQREITQAVRRNLGASLPDLQIGTILGGNDTIAVGNNTTAIAEAEAEDLEVLPTGGVGGTGSNEAFFLRYGYHPLFDLYIPKDDEGFVNTEIGHGLIADDTVSKRVRQRLVAIGEMKEEENYPQPEHILGQYLPLRLAAAVELLAEKGHIAIDNPTEFTEMMIEQSKTMPAFMSAVAINQHRFSSDADINSKIQGLAQQVMIRAGQMYGILKAVSAEPVQELKTRYDKPDASLNEGSTLLLGQVKQDLNVRKVAEDTSAVLGHPLVIKKSDGLTGVAQLALGYEHLENAA